MVQGECPDHRRSPSLTASTVDDNLHMGSHCRPTTLWECLRYFAKCRRYKPYLYMCKSVVSVLFMWYFY